MPTTNAPRNEEGEETSTSTSDSPNKANGLLENAGATDEVNATPGATEPTRRRKGLAAAISVLFRLLLLLGAVTGYLDADAMSKCGECLRSVASSTSTSTSLQIATYANDALRAIAE